MSRNSKQIEDRVEDVSRFLTINRSESDSSESPPNLESYIVNYCSRTAVGIFYYYGNSTLFSFGTSFDYSRLSKVFADCCIICLCRVPRAVPNEIKAWIRFKYSHDKENERV